MIRRLAAVLATLFFAGAAIADPVEGIWKTQVDDGAYAYIDMTLCGEMICGTIARTFNADGEYQSENIGRQLVWDMVPKGGGKYGSGKIWQPSKDKIFKSKMTLSGAILKVSGCFLVACKKQTWTRVN